MRNSIGKWSVPFKCNFRNSILLVTCILMSLLVDRYELVTTTLFLILELFFKYNNNSFRGWQDDLDAFCNDWQERAAEELELKGNGLCPAVGLYYRLTLNIFSIMKKNPSNFFTFIVNETIFRFKSRIFVFSNKPMLWTLYRSHGLGWLQGTWD